MQEKPTCQQCGQTQLIQIEGKINYLDSPVPITEVDLNALKLTVCLGCGRVQGRFPATPIQCLNEDSKPLPYPGMDAGDGELFVVVNRSRLIWPGGFNEHPVLPGEDPHTFNCIPDAAEALADLASEYNHTPESAPIYRLVPVPVAIVRPLLEKVLAAIPDGEMS